MEKRWTNVNPTSRSSIEGSDFYTEGTIQWLLDVNKPKIEKLLKDGLITVKNLEAINQHLPTVEKWIKNEGTVRKEPASKRSVLTYIALAQKLIAEKEKEAALPRKKESA